MSALDRFDRDFAQALADLAEPRTPDYLDDVIERAVSRPQRPAWTFSGWWLPTGVLARRPALVPALPRRTIGLFIIMALLLAALFAIGLGALLQRTPPPSIVHGEFTVTGPLTVDAGREISVMSSAALPDDRILVIGTSLIRTSGSFGERPWAAIYEPRAGTFAETGAPSIVRSLSTLTALKDGRVLLAGSSLHLEMFPDPEQADPASAEIWDPASGRFERTGQMSVGRYGHTATLLRDGRVLVAGGDPVDATEGIRATAELYDPQTGAWREVGGMIEPERIYAAAAQLADGRVLLTGGLTGDELSSTAELFDPSSQTFSAVGRMAVGRAEHTATTLADGRVLVTGGVRLSSSGTLDGDATSTAELFDPATGAFESAGPMTTERTQHAAVRVGDRVLIVGGQNIDGSPRTAELFDPATSSFLAAGRAPTGGPDTAASILPNGNVLAMAGTTAPVLWAAADVAAHDPGVWAPAGRGFSGVEWPTLRDGQTATALGDGRVLIAGGSDIRSGEPTAAAQLFDPQSGATTAIQMQLAHSDHAAVRLGDGRVLIVGNNGAELFDPATEAFQATDAPPFPSGGRGWSPTSDVTHAVVLADGRVLVLGRSGPASVVPGYPERIPAIYDPVTGTFSGASDIECETRGAPVRMLDDRVFVPCGNASNQAIVYDPTGASPIVIPGRAGWTNAAPLASGGVLVTSDSGTAAIFDPRSMSFVATQSSPMARAGAVAHPLADGRVLIVGGADLGDWTPLRAAELYDPSSGLFVDVGPMVDSRFVAAVDELADGRVFIVGGSRRSPDRTDPTPSGAEIFDPTQVP
ncbi:MAG TPA: kelch repeat-containing protein [Candidatus Limnocylindria bacterium]|nr:kelch repeat-containing protein [Candidatus Limnocylindria bacterium]